MNILAITNLYPRPDEPQRGMFNAQLFRAVAREVSGVGRRVSGEKRLSPLSLLCLVPEWRVWRWPAVRQWIDPTGQPEVEVRYVPVFYVPKIGRNLSGATYRMALERHADAFRACDAVLATWLYPDAAAAAVLAERARKPLWIKAHGSDRFHLEHPRRRAAIMRACRYARGLLPNSDFLAEALVQAGVEQEAVHVVRHGIDTKRFHVRPRAEALRELLADAAPAQRPVLESLAAGTRAALFVGNLVHVKGPDLLVDAFARTASGDVEDGPLLLVLGAGPMQPVLAASAERRGLAGRVHFLGSVPHAQVALWMNAANVLCLTSRSEGMPNVVLEALASGVPVVASDVGDVPRTVRDSENGFVVARAGNAFADRFASRLKQALAAEWDAERIARSVAGCTWEGAARRVAELMKQARAPEG